MRKLQIAIEVKQNNGAINHFELRGDLGSIKLTQYRYCQEPVIVNIFERDEIEDLHAVLTEYLVTVRRIDKLK